MTKRNSSLKWFYLKSTTDSLNSLALKQINNLAVIKHTISNLRKSICQSSQKKTDSSFSHTILLLYPDRRYAFIIFNPFKIPSNIFSTLSIRNLAAIISHTHIDSSTESHQKLATIPNSQRAPENRFSSGDPAIYSWTRYRGCTGPGGRAMTLNFQEKGGGEDRRAYPGAPHRRCIAHYLMDGFSLCSVDSLTTGVPDCTLRRFSGATENQRPPRCTRGDTVASLHNEQDAATPLELVLRASPTPLFPRGRLSPPAWPPPPPPPPPLLPSHRVTTFIPLINLLFLRITLRRVALRASQRRDAVRASSETAKMMGRGGKKRSRVPETRETSRGYGTKI